MCDVPQVSKVYQGKRGWVAGWVAAHRLVMVGLLVGQVAACKDLGQTQGVRGVVWALAVSGRIAQMILVRVSVGIQ